jgi:hypothetical protein
MGVVRKKLPKIRKWNCQKSVTWIFSTIVTNTMNCLKHNNEFLAVKNQQVYSAKDPHKLLEILNSNKIDPRYTVIVVMKVR